MLCGRTRYITTRVLLIVRRTRPVGTDALCLPRADYPILPAVRSLAHPRVCCLFGRGFALPYPPRDECTNTSPLMVSVSFHYTTWRIASTSHAPSPATAPGRDTTTPPPPTAWSSW